MVRSSARTKGVYVVDPPDFGEVRVQLRQLADRVAQGEVGHTDLWGGADVVVSMEVPPAHGSGFYPDPRTVTTPYAHELSWLIYQLRDIFADHYDSQSKIEFFGRLANAALRYQSQNTTPQLTELLGAVIHEAFAMADEMEEGRFQSFAIAFGNEIVDDYVDEAERRGYVGIEETMRFFSEKGLEL